MSYWQRMAPHQRAIAILFFLAIPLAAWQVLLMLQQRSFIALGVAIGLGAMFNLCYYLRQIRKR